MALFWVRREISGITWQDQYPKGQVYPSAVIGYSHKKPTRTGSVGSPLIREKKARPNFLYASLFWKIGKEQLENGRYESDGWGWEAGRFVRIHCA